jgi:hypothetical protein
MKRFVPYVALTAAVGALVALTGRPVEGQAPAPGRLVMFADMALFSGPNQPRNCFTMNRFKAGEPAGFRVSVMDGATGQPAADATVVVHLTYGGKTEDVAARYRGPGGRGQVIPNLWTAKWTVPANAPTGRIDVTITAMDKSGRMAEWKPFPNEASHLTIVNE